MWREQEKEQDFISKIKMAVGKLEEIVIHSHVGWLKQVENEQMFNGCNDGNREPDSAKKKKIEKES